MSTGPKLNWSLTLEERQRVADGAGGFSETWVALGQLWGELRTRGVGDGAVAAGELHRVRYRIIVRGSAEGELTRPKTGQRFRTGNRVFDIDAVTEMDATGRYLIVWAREERLA